MYENMQYKFRASIFCIVFHSGETGMKILDTEIFISNGESKRDGVNTTHRNAHYYWRKVVLSHHVLYNDHFLVSDLIIIICVIPFMESVEITSKHEIL